jgi:hypothetical protein
MTTLTPKHVRASRLRRLGPWMRGKPTGRRVTAFVAVSFVIAYAAAGYEASPGDGSVCNGPKALGVSSGVSDIPAACWRPYANTSPFNRLIPRKAKSATGSRQIINELLAGGPISELVAGDPALEDSTNPTYYSSPADPTYTLHCVEPWGRCEIEGLTVRVPARATPGGGYATPAHDFDAHMTIVDPVSGWEYDLFNVHSKPAGGGRLDFGWGGRTRIDGDGLGSEGTAARFGLLAGAIRSPELVAGRIDHALRLVVPCVSGIVPPAAGAGLSCTSAGFSTTYPPKAGQRLQLKISSRRIKRLHLPPWKRAIAVAMRRYGAYISDTTGARDQWGFEIEGGAGYESFGLEDPMVTLAKQLGLRGDDSNGNGFPEYRFLVAGQIPWNKLRVVRAPHRPAGS